MNDIYSIDRTRFLPSVLQKDSNILGLAKAISGQMNTVAQEIRQNIIYPRIDELSEEILDILAYDLHVDWFDYADDVETKRRIIRNSVKIHMKMGTKYAVETATSDVYPNTTVDEWFEYEGEPYFFRLNIDISDKGITTTQQISLVERIHFYKNARSHLDYIAFQWESTTEINLGCFSVVSKTIEIMPFLVDEIAMEVTTETHAHVNTNTNMELLPFLADNILLETSAMLSTTSITETTMELLPYLVESIDLDTEISLNVDTSSQISLEIQPILVKEIPLQAEIKGQGGTVTETSTEIQPILVKEIPLQAEIKGQGGTVTETSMEIQPILQGEIQLEAEMLDGGQVVIDQTIQINTKETEE